MYSDDLDSVTNNLRDSAKGSNDGYDVAFPLTGYEPNDTELNDTELNDTVPSKFFDSQDPLFHVTPSLDQDMDDTTLGKLLAEVHRDYAYYRSPEGVFVSPSSMSVTSDRTGKPVEKSDIDQFCFSVRNMYSAHNQFPAITQTERMVDRTGKPVEEITGIAEERESSSAQIRTLFNEQRRTIIAECCEKVSHHEFQAARAEQERKILQEELWRQQQDFREVHQQNLTEMEELRKFQSSTFDTHAKLIEDQNTIMELSGRLQELQNEVNCMNDSKDFQDAESVRSGNSHVTSQPRLFPKHPIPEGLLRPSFVSPRRKEGPPDIWDTSGISGNVFANPQASSSAPYPQELNSPWKKTIEEPLHMSTAEKSDRPERNQDLRCQSGPSAKDSVIFSGGDYSKNYGADQQRLQISDFHFDKFPTPATFACWKIRFKTEVCTCSQFPTEAMQWIKEVELVDSVDELRSSSSTRGISMPNFEVLDARIASALNKIIHNSQFKRRISLEEQKAQKEDRFLRGRQIAYLIYDHFRVTGSHDSVENYTDLFTIVLRNDDIQEFDSKWDGILLSMTKIPHDDILEGLYKLRIRESEKLKTVLELYDLETHQKKLGPDYHRLKTMVKRSIEQEIRNKNFGNRIGNFEKNAVVKNQGTKQRVQRILGDCWQWETNGQCVKGDNCSFRHDMNKRGKSSPSNPSPNSFMRQSERKPSRTRSPRGKSPSGRMSRWPCKDYLRGTCNNSFCEKWHPPECLYYKTKSGCRFGEKCAFAHRQVDEQPTKRSKTNNDKSAVAMLKKGNWQESVTDGCHDRTGQPVKRSDKKLGQNSSKRRFSDARQLGCVFQDMTPPKSILRKSTDMPKPIQRVKFTKAIARHTKIRDQNPSLGYICPGEPHERSPNAPKFEDRSQEETEWQEQGAREAAWKLAKSVLKLKEHQRATFFSSPENRCLPASTLKPEEREFVVDSGASMHMISKKDLSNAEMDTLTKSCSPTIVITANGEVQTHEEAIVYVKELDIFLTMKVLDNTPAVLSLGKLCDENGYSYEWINGQKPHLIKDGIRIICNTENFVPIVVPGLSSSSSASSSTSRTPMKQESHSSSSSSSSPSSPTVGEISVREREDAPNSDISPVPVSELVDDRTGKPVETQANEIPNPNKKETTIERGNLCDDSEIPEWLQEFRENLVDDEIPLQGGSHASSSHEVSLEPTTKRREDLGKHNVHTHFPKDRNCEICKRTKITRAPCRRRNGEAVPRAVNFGDLITADHKVLSDNCESRNNHRYAVVVQDLATQWIQAYPCKNKTSQETQRSLQKFLEPERKPKVIYTDNSLEFGKACEDLSWNHCTSTPHRSETNGIAERAVRRVKEGTSAVLLQSGLNESWWADSMECYTYLRNVTDLLSDGKTPYERRFGQPFKGPIIPFGSLVEYHPITAKDQSRIHQFGKKVLPGLFLGYALYAGGIWKGDVLIADLEELETMDASEIYSKRLNAKEVIFPKQGEFIFPIADGRIKTPGGDQELRTSTLVRPRPIQGEGHIDFLGESEGSLPQPHDSLPVAGEAMNDFWSMSGSFIYRHHVEPRVKLYSPREESFPIPLKYIDVTRTTHTNLDVKQEKRIDDYWNIDGSRDLSDPWTGFTQFTLLEEKAPDGYMWSGGRLTRKQLTSRPDHLWPELWKSMGKHAKLKEKQKWSEEKIHLENARKLRGIYFIDPEDTEFKETIKNARKKLETSVAPAMPCKIAKNCGSGASNKIQTKLACILEADESTRMRMGNSIPQHHEDHIAGKGENSLQHYNLVHKFIPMPQAMKIPAAKAAVDKEWEKLEKISAWNLTKVKSKKSVIDEARTSGATVHFASLMDICHLKNAELEAKHQKYKGRVVLRGDIVKDNSGSYAVFTEQGSSASQMTAAKIMDIISRLPGCDGQAADAVSAYTQVKMEDAHKLLKIPKSECPDIWIRLPRHKWPKSWSSMEDPVVPLERNLYGHPLAGLLWERQFEKILLKHGWEKIPNWECLFVHREKGLFLSVYVDDIKLAGKKQNLDPMWKVLNKEVDLGEPTSFLDHVYLGCTQRQCEISKDIVDNYRTMFESRISAGE